MDKKFKLGFTYGRFQMLHKGHESLIDLGLQYCEKFVILVGSCNNTRTKENPFTFEERKEMIQMVYGDKVTILPVVDIGIGYVPQWGNYLVNTVKFNCGQEPEFVVEGAESGRTEWLSNFPNISRVILSRSLINISATDVRNLMLEYSDINLVLNIRKNPKDVYTGYEACMLKMPSSLLKEDYPAQRHIRSLITYEYIENLEQRLKLVLEKIYEKINKNIAKNFLISLINILRKDVYKYPL